MQIHSRLHLDNSHQLSIELPNSTTDNEQEIKIGIISEQALQKKGKTFLIGQDHFYMSPKDISSLKKRTIDLLHFSQRTKKAVEKCFDEAFSKNTITEKEYGQIVDTGLTIENLIRKMDYVMKNPGQNLSKEDFDFIFAAEDFLRIMIDNHDASLESTKHLELVYDELVLPLMMKAKESITSGTAHQAATAASEKGRAYQAGLNTFRHIEEEGRQLAEQMKQEKVRLFPGTGAVLKRGSAQSREEEHQIEQLMHLSIKKGTVPFFTFSKMASEQLNVSHTDSKPYVDGMLTLQNLLDNKKLSQNILKNLSFESELRALLTVEFQFLDLHSDNLGIVPLINKEDDCFCECTFTYGLKTNVSFSAFLQDYLSGKVKDNQKISCSSPNEKVKSNGFLPISEIPGLRRALKSPWDFVLFDSDKVLAESNHLQEQTRNGKSEFLIPLRNVLLGTEWRNRPLAKETLAALNNPDRDLRIRSWVNRTTAPIKQWLSGSEETDRLVKKVLEQDKYTLSYHRRKGVLITVAELQQMFTEDLSDLQQHREFWEMIDADLRYSPKGGWFKPYTVKNGDTWESIARMHNLSESELKALNPEDEKLEADMQLKTKDVLTSESPSARRQRHYIAKQFFPRLSWKQRDALIERQERRREYLSNVERFNRIRNASPQSLKELEQLLLDETTPLDSTSKNELLEKVRFMQKQATELSQNDFNEIIKFLNGVFTPTFFNLTKAMYPLLPDAYALTLILAKNNLQTAGLNIGLYSMPLETVVNESRNTQFFGSSNRRSSQLANSLDTEISNAAQSGDAAFFGIWEEELGLI